MLVFDVSPDVGPCHAYPSLEIGKRNGMRIVMSNDLRHKTRASRYVRLLYSSESSGGDPLCFHSEPSL
jgi:hypothetical protein